MQYIGLYKSCRVGAVEIIRTVRSRLSIQVRNKSALNLAHRIYGRSPTPESVPIIVLPDCLGTKFNWDSVCRKLTSSTKKPVIAVDARNHGESPFSDTHDYESLAADVSQLLSEFAIDDSIIIGHGIGGRTGMVLALNEPSKVASLIVIDISPVSTSCKLSDWFPNTLDVLMSIDFKGLDLYQSRTEARKKILENNLFDNDDEIQQLLLNIGKLPDHTFGWKYNLNALKKEFTNLVSFPDTEGLKYTAPTLFLAGKLSYYVPTEDISGIRDLFPNATFLYLDGVGHNVHLEEPSGLLSAVVRFLEYNALIQS